jgi:uncharacterized protein
MADRPRFAVDEMLGSLARWLRIMGYDAAYEKGLNDTAMLEKARQESRTLLTRDKQLAARAGKQGLLVRSDVLEEQIAEVASAYALRFDESRTRCTLCNGLLRPAREEELTEVPPRVRERHTEFFVCEGCGQIYWNGTHWKNIREQLRKALAPEPASPED